MSLITNISELPIHIQELGFFLNENIHLLDFTKIVPYGLVITSIENEVNRIQLENHPGFVVIRYSPGSSILGVVPALERLKVSRLENINFPKHFSNNVDDLIWLYSYAKAKKNFSKITFNNLPNHIRVTWNSMIEEVLAGSIDSLNFIYYELFCEYQAPKFESLEKFRNSESKRAWEKMQSCISFGAFLGEINLQQENLKEPNFYSLSRARYRTLVHYSYGVKLGIAATDSGDFAKSKEELEYLVYWLSNNPIVYENHDLDRPIGLMFKPHIKSNGERSEARYSVHITDSEHWNRHHEFNGSSLGVFYE